MGNSSLTQILDRNDKAQVVNQNSNDRNKHNRTGLKTDWTFLNTDHLERYTIHGKSAPPQSKSESSMV